MNWFRRIFSKNRTSRTTLGDVAMMFISAEKEVNDMACFIWENAGCDLLDKGPSKNLKKRYSSIRKGSLPLAWYLLEKYFEGKIEIKE